MSAESRGAATPCCDAGIRVIPTAPVTVTRTVASVRRLAVATRSGSGWTQSAITTGESSRSGSESGW